MARLAVASHLGLDELERRYRRALAPVACSQRQIGWLVAQGKLAQVGRGGRPPLQR
jgi:hypothetical protein